MTHERTQSAARQIAVVGIGVLGLSVLVMATGCKQPASAALPDTTLRVGVGAVPQQAPQAGMRQFVGTQAIEPLAEPNDDGRLRPRLAESWSLAPGGLSLTVRLFANAKFHDGTPVTGTIVSDALRKTLPPIMGPAYDDVAQITAPDLSTVRFDLRRRSQFILEALETDIQEPGKRGVGTGPFINTGGTTSPVVLKANDAYYREHPSIRQISVTSYPSVRAAWAELLRGNLDMLTEVDADALFSLQDSTQVRVFSYVRHYQYAIAFGPNAPMFQSADVRQELSAALDRAAIVHDALNGHGVPSSGPVPTEHWAISGQVAAPVSRELAKRLASRHLKFTCLVPPDPAFERIALAVRRQLTTVSVDMQIVEASQEEIARAAEKGTYDAVLADFVSGPTMFRLYRLWYSKKQGGAHVMTSRAVDAAFERINHAVDDVEYRAAVQAFERAMADEPPALFLAWSERARAVSRRFDVPTPQNGQDVLNTLRLWKPAPQGVTTN